MAGQKQRTYGTAGGDDMKSPGFSARLEALRQRFGQSMGRVSARHGEGTAKPEPGYVGWLEGAGLEVWFQQPALYVALAVALVFCWAFWGLNQFLAPYPIPFALKVALAPALAMMPLLWLLLAKNHRVCLSLATLILLAGDMAPTLVSPIVALVTISNGLYLLWQHRHSQIRWILLPFMLLSVGYFVNAFLWDFIDRPVMVSYAMVVNLGWWGALGGGLLVYHLMYFFLTLYHVAVFDKDFLKGYVWILMGFINVVVLVGLLQSLMVIFGGDDMVKRIPSIMRLATRLAPFIVVSLPIFIIQLLESPSKREKTFFVVVHRPQYPGTQPDPNPGGHCWGADFDGVFCGGLMAGPSVYPITKLLCHCHRDDWGPLVLGQYQ
jgi:hypothetical protein